MKSLLLSPHSDDAELFAAFTIQREKPHVIICTESWLQFNRGTMITEEQRWAETIAASEVLGYPVAKLGIRDDLEFSVLEETIEKALTKYVGKFDKIYAPALQGGNAHHDIVSRVATKLFGDKVVQYTTYTRNVLWTVGNIEVIPTEEEKQLKIKALMCHQSQFNLPSTRPHFDAVFGRSEWLL